jgi:hypothetical protein
MKNLFIFLALLISHKFYGQDIFRYTSIYPNGIIYLDSTLNVGKQYLIFRNDSTLELKKGTFGGCKRIIIHLNSKKKVKEMQFYYSEDFAATKYISNLDSLYGRSVISYRLIKDAKYKIYSSVDQRTILEFKELIEGNGEMKYACILKSRNL